MKKQLFTFFILLISISSNAQIWQWAASAGISGGTETATAVATDANGYVYIAGNFTGSSITFGGTTLNNGGGSDMFLAKYDPWGGFIWAKRVGGTNSDKVNAISIDFSGNVLITGTYSSNVLSFGSVFLTNTSAGFSDLFIAKFDGGGTVMWAKKGGGNGDDVANSICTDPSGNLYITGSFTGSTIAFGTTSLTKSGTMDFLIAKFDLNGSLLWAEHAGSAGSSAEGNGVVSDASGNVFATGYYQGSNFGFGTNTLTNAGGKDIFIVKYDITGTSFWAKSAGGIDHDIAKGICIDAGGNLTITGNYFSAVAIFSSNTITNTNALNDDIFVARYDASGNIGWVKSAGSNGSDAAKSIACDALDNVYISGYFSSLITFGSTMLISNGAQDIFIARYSASGIAGYAKAAGGSGNEVAHSITIDQANNAYMAGGFLSASFPLGNTTLLNADLGDSISDMFIARLNHVNSIDDLMGFNSLYITPNPSSGQFSVKLPEGAVQINIFNANGKIIQSRYASIKLSESFQIIDSGIYFLQIITDKGIVNKKLIINN